MKPETLQNLVADLAAWRERPAAGLRRAYGAYWWSYWQLYEEACGVAAFLRDTGIAPGERLVLWAGNSPEWVAWLLGAILRGVVVVPADSESSPAAVQRLADEVAAALLVYGPEQEAAGLDVARKQPLLAATAAAGPLETVRLAARPDDPAVILFTSGTTQRPKGVILTHANLLWQTERFRGWRGLLRLLPCRLLALSPLSHVQGLLMGAFVPLRLGLSVLYSDAVQPAHVMRAIRQNRVTLLLAVPRVQHLLARALQRTPYGRGGQSLGEYVAPIRFFPLRRHHLFLGTHAHLGYTFWVLLVGGATLPRADERFWYECGYVLVQGYGLTETAALVSVGVNSPFFARLGSIGRPLDEGMVQLAADGEILVRGPNVTPGYYGAAGDEVGGGFLHTGDVGQRDERKRLYFLGRKKDVIVTGEGHNVYPAEVKEALRRQAGVRDAAVIGLESQGHPEVHAVLLLEPGATAGAAVREANAALEPHQQVHGWTVWPEADFPRTGLLKVRVEEVAAAVRQWREHGQSPPAATGRLPSLEEIKATGDRGRRLALLADYLAAGPPEGTPGGSLRLAQDLGFGSLDVVELLGLLEQRWGAALTGPALPAAATVADVQGLAWQRPAARPRAPLHAPGWSRGAPGSLARAFSQPAVMGLWRTLAARVAAEWPEGRYELPGRFIIAAAPHRHWLDGFVVYAASPRRARRRLLVLTNRDFHEYFDPAPGTPWAARLSMGLAYYLWTPLCFPFAIVPPSGGTREGLYEVGRMIDRGYNPLTFPKGLFFHPEDRQRHDRGVALMALQTRLPVVPVWLVKNDGLRLYPQRRRPQVTARWGRPVEARPGMGVEALVVEVEAAFGRLEGV